MTILIKNGTVITSTGADPAEVLIDGEQIVAVLQPGSDTSGTRLLQCSSESQPTSRLVPALARRSVPMRRSSWR